MNISDITQDFIIDVMRTIKPYFKEKLGKNTHKKSSDDWRFYGLAFTHPDMIYVFGINIGFFRRNDEEAYNYIGMNVLIRTNGENPERRHEILSFFRDHLNHWVNLPESDYTSDRGGIGRELARYRHLESFADEEEIIEFLKECIDGIHAIYPKIVDNSKLFDGIVRAAPQWDTALVEFCKSVI